MKRDPRLRGLSSDHHHALRLARSLEQAHRRGALDEPWIAMVRDRYERELLPHFLQEEAILLPALSAVGAADLADRTRAEHCELARLLDRAEGGEVESLARFGERLEAHVRFEERALSPTCEARLPSRVLDDVARRAPSRLAPA